VSSSVYPQVTVKEKLGFNGRPGRFGGGRGGEGRGPRVVRDGRGRGGRGDGREAGGSPDC
jgi:hypothetical protein